MLPLLLALAAAAADHDGGIPPPFPTAAVSDDGDGIPPPFPTPPGEALPDDFPKTYAEWRARPRGGTRARSLPKAPEPPPGLAVRPVSVLPAWGPAAMPIGPFGVMGGYGGFGRRGVGGSSAGACAGGG